MLSRVLVTLAAIALIASATPSEDLLKRAGQPIDPMSSHLHRLPAQLHRKDGQTPAQVVELVMAQAVQKPETIKTLTEAIDTIIDQVVKRSEDQQELLDNEVEVLSNCSQIPTIDATANQKAADAKTKISPAQDEVDKHSTGTLSVNFGDDPTSSSIERTTARLKIDKYKENVDKAFQALDLSEENYKLAQEASDRLDQLALEKNQGCQCVAKKGYKGIKKTAVDATKNILADLVHFSLIKCVMTQFGDDKKEQAAFEKCMDDANKKTLVDFGLVELDYKESEVQLDEDTKDFCKKTPPPTPSPTAPTPAPTKTFGTVLAGKANDMVWAPYGKDQPTGQTLFGYGTGREIKDKRKVNMANVKGSLCDVKSLPLSLFRYCKFQDKNAQYKVAKFEAIKNRNIKAFCINEDDVTYYLMSSVHNWVTIASRCPTKDEVMMIPNDKKEDGTAVSDEKDSFRWAKYEAPSEQCPDNKGCQWKQGEAPECQKAQATKGEWTCYKQYAQTDPDLCNKGGVCAGYGR